MSDQIRSQNIILEKLSEAFQTMQAQMTISSREVESNLENLSREVESNLENLSREVESNLENLSRVVESKLESVQLGFKSGYSELKFEIEQFRNP